MTDARNVVVPIDPTPEMLGSWYRVKNGHHYHDEPPPTDTSDYAAYRAMLAAAPAPSSLAGGEVEDALKRLRVLRDQHRHGTAVTDADEYDADELDAILAIITPALSPEAPAREASETWNPHQITPNDIAAILDENDDCSDEGGGLLNASQLAEKIWRAGLAAREVVDLHAIAKDAAERVHKNGGCVPQMAYAPSPLHP